MSIIPAKEFFFRQKRIDEFLFLAYSKRKPNGNLGFYWFSKEILWFWERDDFMNEKFDAFLMEHQDLYEKDLFDSIKERGTSFLEEEIIPDVFMQIYDAIGILPDDKNNYLKFLKLLKQRYVLEKNILEVGCGILPRLGVYLSKQQTENGTVTVMDPVLGKEFHHLNFTGLKQKVDEFTDFSPYDLVIGQYPCEATEITIEKACEYQKDFYLLLCGCTHFRSPLPFMTMPNFYHEYLYEKTTNLLQKYDNGKLKVLKPGNENPFLYPIITNEK